MPTVADYVGFFLMLPAATMIVCTCLYWHYHKEEVASGCRSVCKVILGIISYPLTVFAIILMHLVCCLLTIIQFTGKRVAGVPMKSIVCKTTFD